MNKKFQNIIPKPCFYDWSEMKTCKGSSDRICSQCNEKVYDIRNLTKTESENLFSEQNKNICVIANSSQLNSLNKKPYLNNIRNLGIASMIIASSLLTSELQAQNRKKLDTYTIEQTEIHSDTIVLEGIIKGERKIGWKKLKEIGINIYSNEKLIRTIDVENGKFKINIVKSEINEKFSVSINALGFKKIKINNLNIKNTKIKVYMKKKETLCTVGRWY